MGGIATIGVYGWDPEEFIGALTGAAVEVLVDVREQDGARADGSWASAERLEAALAETGIEYRQRPDLTSADADLSEIVRFAERTLPALLVADEDAPVVERLQREHGLTQVHFLPQND